VFVLSLSRTSLSGKIRNTTFQFSLKKNIFIFNTIVFKQINSTNL